MNENILDDQQFINNQIRRRDLLPTWIKVFTWIFLIFGAIVPFVLVFGILGMRFDLSLYGLEATEPFSLAGILLTFLFAMKAIVAFGLWTEKEWAVNFAIIDAILGIVLCVFMMFVMPFVTKYGNINLRLELIPLILYLIKMKKIEKEWMARN